MPLIRHMAQYNEDFKVGSLVRVKNRKHLEDFQRQWKFHHPLQNSQLDFAGKCRHVIDVSFYHGGDVLYRLNGASGLWHEQCLEMPPQEISAQ